MISINTNEIVKNYIEGIINGKGIDLESYVREIFKSENKDELIKYCEENSIYYKKGSSREVLLEKIYGSCNTQMSYSLLSTSRASGESKVDFYKKIYARDFLNKDFKQNNKSIAKEEPKEYLDYIKNSKNKYPERIMKTLRKVEGLSEYDFSRDGEINNFSPNETFEKIMDWNDMSEESDIIKEWIKDIYKVDLDNIK